MFVSGCKLPKIPDLDREPESVDSTRTQLYVGNYNGGIGEKWLWDAKERFEVIHPEVQIMIDNGKDEYSTGNLMSNIKTNRQDMYIVDDVSYYTLANAGHLMEITDLVTKGGDDSIDARMNDSLKAFYKTPNEKYYAVPFYEGFYHMIYDADLFEEYNLWLNVQGTGFVETKTEPRYPGLSGKPDAWDEGLPRTYSQFFMLLDHMYNLGITPLTWSGKFKDPYLPYFLNSLMADYQGVDFANNFNYTGKVKVLKNYDFSDAPVGQYAMPQGNYETVTVEKSNAKQTFAKAAAKYYTIKFAKDIVSNGYKYVNQLTVNSSSETQTMAQDTFLRSRYLGKPIGMLIDGGWWYNEASVPMQAMADEYGEEWSKMNRKFGVMPFPKADDGSSAEGRTFAATAGSCVFISSYTTKAAIAKEFFEFINTKDSMERFTKTTSIKRPYDYELSESDFAQMPPYSKSLFDASSEANFIYMVPNAQISPEMLPLQASLIAQFGSDFEDVSSGNPIVTFFENTRKTAKSYFQGLLTAAARK